MENIRYYWFMADTSGDFAALSLVSRLPASFPGSGLFGNQIVRRVSFTVEPGPNGQHQLVLRQTPLLEPPETARTPYTNSSRAQRESVLPRVLQHQHPGMGRRNGLGPISCPSSSSVALSVGPPHRKADRQRIPPLRRRSSAPWPFRGSCRCLLSGADLAAFRAPPPPASGDEDRFAKIRPLPAGASGPARPGSVASPSSS